MHNQIWGSTAYVMSEMRLLWKENALKAQVNDKRVNVCPPFHSDRLPQQNPGNSRGLQEQSFNSSSFVVSFHLFAFSFSWATLACPSLAWTSTGRSKKLTKLGSLRREARTCSNENDHSVSVRSGPASWLSWEPVVVELSGVVGASLGEDSSSSTSSAAAAAGESAVLAGFVDSGGLLGSCSLRPTSSILRRRLVTWATARYRDSSSGSPWNMLYRVLENWMNWVWDLKEQKSYNCEHFKLNPFFCCHFRN